VHRVILGSQTLADRLTDGCIASSQSRGRHELFEETVHEHTSLFEKSECTGHPWHTAHAAPGTGRKTTYGCRCAATAPTRRRRFGFCIRQPLVHPGMTAWRHKDAH
jgi:hypothetical protein